LQLLFPGNVFPELDVSQGAVEVEMAVIRDHEFYRKSLQEVFVILSSISLGMEIMKLRQTSYQAIHELKNKLISAQSWINCLKEDLELAAPDAVEQEDIKEDIHLAQDAVTAGANLAVSYLQFTRIYNPQFVQAQVNDVLRDAASDIQAFADSAAGEGKVRVTTELDARIPLRQLDPAHLKMALFNLGKNATEALLEHGIPEPRVTLRSAWGDHITIEVSDNGKGMPPEIAQNLFVAFKTKKAGGTGLGLTIAKKIVDIHRGMIRCDTGPTGTTFTLQF
jgi:signal transduction histidine kinase